MIRQYAQVLKSTIAGESTIDPNTGEIIPGDVITIEHAIRYLPNPSAKLVRTTDGQSVIYRGTCYIHKGLAPELNNGDLVSVPGFVDVPVPILQIHRAQFRTRVIL